MLWGGWGAELEDPIAIGCGVYCGSSTNEVLTGESVGAAYPVVVGAAIVMVGVAYEGAA